MNEQMSKNGTFVSFEPTHGEQQAFDLGRLMGQRRSLTLVAGRCTAAHIESLRKIRDDRLYSQYASSWAQFCTLHLAISRRHADRLIALLNEFGPVYFELASLVGITPEQYRLIEPCVRENALHVGAEVIALKPANVAPILDAVDQLLRGPARSAPARNWDDKLTRLERQGAALAARFESLLQSRMSRHQRDRVLESLRALRIHLGSLEPLDA